MAKKHSDDRKRGHAPEAKAVDPDAPDGAASGDPDPSKPPVDPAWACAEDNPWTPILPADDSNDDDVLAHIRKVDPSQRSLVLSLQSVDAGEHDRIVRARRMTFHAVGCTGDPVVQTPQEAVADAMAGQLGLPQAPSFLYHLGDIAYKHTDENLLEDGEGALKGGKMMESLYSNELYAAYRKYNRPLFAIPGNHDGKYKVPDEGGAMELKKSPMWHFLKNFCAKQPASYPNNPDGAGDPSRVTQTQPYPYWVLETPAAFIIGLYTNVLNGGALDDPGAASDPTGAHAVQFNWLVSRLLDIKTVRNGRALIVATHYPPYSGTADFDRRGAPQSPTTPGPRPTRPLADVLQAAFAKAGEWPDLILSAHAHLYQRIVYTLPGGDGKPRSIPCLIAGCGGHGPIEHLWNDCRETPVPEQRPPFPAVLPDGYKLPKGHSATIAAYNDLDFGFLRITVDLDHRRLTGDYFAVYPLDVHDCLSADMPHSRTRHDAFTVDLANHTVTGNQPPGWS